MIKIVCVGSLKEDYLKKLTSDYIKRINKYHKLEIIELKDSNIKEEKDRILKQIKQTDYVVAMSINSLELSTIEFSSLIDKQLQINPNITFVIGGSDGLHEDVRKRSNLELSFSKLTFPHGLFRGILLEQIYRSFKILNNESYHK